MSFLRHREIYPSDGGKTLTGRAPAHRLDEFPTGYSLAGCSPAEPASASPASLILLRLHSFVYEVSANGNLSLVFVSHQRGAAHRLSRFSPCREGPWLGTGRRPETAASRRASSTFRFQSSAAARGALRAKRRSPIKIREKIFRGAA